MDIVAELALCDGPGLLVVTLEGSYLGAYNRCVTIPIVVHAPVVHSRQEICSKITARMHNTNILPHIYGKVLQPQRGFPLCIGGKVQGAFLLT